MKRLLIANRGEIAVRIARSAGDLGITSVALYSQDEAQAWHVAVADESIGLSADGPQAYLDVEAVVAAALAADCDALHPGYGLLSESEALARACAEANITFVGPSPEALAALGDKAVARELAAAENIPVLRGTMGATALEEAQAFLAELNQTTPDAAVILKAIAGGGGRGMRIAHTADELASVFDSCSREAHAAFGDGRLYVEEYLLHARHVEVQIIGDGTDVLHLFDRECSLQRRHQKVVEIAPAFMVPSTIRQGLFEAAVALGKAVTYQGLGTVEFLVSGDQAVYIESNPRLQVEHTVTEEITGLDLVALQLQIAAGSNLAELGLIGNNAQTINTNGVAIQLRVNAETINPDGTPRSSSGTVNRFDLPGGPGIRVDTALRGGQSTNPRFDSLIAKLIVHSPHEPASGGWDELNRRVKRALNEFTVTGLATNQGFLAALLETPQFAEADFNTNFITDNTVSLVERANAIDAERATQTTGADHQESTHLTSATVQTPEGTTAITAHTDGTIIRVNVQTGDTVSPGDELVIIEAMKMEHVVVAAQAGTVHSVMVEPNAMVAADQALLFVLAEDIDIGDLDSGDTEVDLDYIRPDLAEVIERHRVTTDAARPKAVERRHSKGQRTIRENLDHLCDPGTFTEWGALTIGARRRRNSVAELIEQTPADGFVMGMAHVNGDLFDATQSRCTVMGYDYTVLAGTQGANNHFKLDRMAELALRWRLPTILFAEGGGGRPGDTEGGGFTRAFEFWGKLSGAVPLVGIVSGRCFAGNAALLGCCDVIIATEDTSLGMGGPAMVEGGGLGVYAPEEIGPIDVMQDNGVIDVLVKDEAEAVEVAKKYLSYFQGRVASWECADQRLLRHAIPENRLRAYDIRALMELMVDTDSLLELRPRFGKAMITAFARVEGFPVGIIANNPMHIGGAIDSDAADKASRFMQLCEAYDIPVVSLSDTPGNMVGPEAETTGLIRHCSRMFVIGANLTVPLLSVILRKSYGLGAIAMTGGSYQASLFSISWPTGEFGGMGLEGAVKLGYRNELAAIEDPEERQATFDRMVAALYDRGKALSTALAPALDDVIDPADTRRWIVTALEAQPPRPVRTEKKVPWIDAW